MLIVSLISIGLIKNFNSLEKALLYRESDEQN